LKLYKVRQIVQKYSRFAEMVYSKSVYVRTEWGACGVIHCRSGSWAAGI